MLVSIASAICARCQVPRPEALRLISAFAASAATQALSAYFVFFPQEHIEFGVLANALLCAFGLWLFELVRVPSFALLRKKTLPTELQLAAATVNGEKPC